MVVRWLVWKFSVKVERADPAEVPQSDGTLAIVSNNVEQLISFGHIRVNCTTSADTTYGFRWPATVTPLTLETRVSSSLAFGRKNVS